MRWAWQRLVHSATHRRLSSYAASTQLKPNELSFSEVPRPFSLLAAKAVRLACSNGAFRDAHFIINSLHASNHPNSHSEPIKLPFMPAFQFTPITFDQPISPRLSAHVLLHHMIRHESPLRAYETAQSLINKGIPLRQATLVKVTQSLLHAPPTVFTVLKEKGATIFGTAEDTLPINPDAADDDGLRFALALLLKARENRRQCSDRAFEALVNFCLLQGEIIMGSLLFVLLIKDFEAKELKAQELKARIVEQERQGAASPQLIDHWKELLSRRLPPKRLLNVITRQCEEELSDDSGDHGEALQGLANLAALIHSRSLPFSDISSLLRVLYSCPKLPNTVVVVQGHGEQTVNAHRHFHRVILGLLKDPPTRKGKDPPNKVMPPLSRETYNSLVHYALRHRLSVKLACGVLHHMERVRQPPLKPDVTTYNIIVRSGTLVRHNNIASMAVEELRKLKENSDHGITVSPSTPRRPLRDSPHLLSRFLKVSPTSDIPADMYTLMSYIAHLTSTGDPYVVATILLHVLPELAIIDHPTWGDDPPNVQDRAVMAQDARRGRLSRAVRLGPRFFTAILNALCKAGKTGLAERVWLLAKEAERASWLRAGKHGPKATEGWCLPLHAYTIMLQLYAAEARHSPRVRQMRHTREDAGWQPAERDKVKGWAYYVLARDKLASRHRSRRALALRMGAALYSAMYGAARDIYNTVIGAVPSAQPRVYNLVPDARFFNAALSMFGREPGMIRRAVRTGPAHWRQKERRAMVRYSRRGGTPPRCNPFLQQVVHGILDAGFEVPMAYRRLFVGTELYPLMNRPGVPLVNRQPYVFPKAKRRFLPHTLPRNKERGLPIRPLEWRKAGKAWQLRRQDLQQRRRTRKVC